MLYIGPGIKASMMLALVLNDSTFPLWRDILDSLYLGALLCVRYFAEMTGEIDIDGPF